MFIQRIHHQNPILSCPDPNPLTRSERLQESSKKRERNRGVKRRKILPFQCNTAKYLLELQLSLRTRRQGDKERKRERGGEKERKKEKAREEYTYSLGWVGCFN